MELKDYQFPQDLENQIYSLSLTKNSSASEVVQMVLRNHFSLPVPEDTKMQHTAVEGKLYLKMHHVFMSDKREEGKSDFFMTIEQIEGDE